MSNKKNTFDHPYEESAAWDFSSFWLESLWFILLLLLHRSNVVIFENKKSNVRWKRFQNIRKHRKNHMLKKNVWMYAYGWTRKVQSAITRECLDRSSLSSTPSMCGRWSMDFRNLIRKRSVVRFVRDFQVLQKCLEPWRLLCFFVFFFIIVLITRISSSLC